MAGRTLPPSALPVGAVEDGVTCSVNVPCPSKPVMSEGRRLPVCSNVPEDKLNLVVCDGVSEDGECGEELLELYGFGVHVEECEACGTGESMGEEVMHGRLKRCVAFWEEMGASRWVLDILERGYRLPFVKEPPSGIEGNQSSCWSHKQFVSDAVQALMDCGSAVEVQRNEVVFVSPLGVVEGALKCRLILDLRTVNKCLTAQKFKLDDIRTACKLFQKGDYVVTFDLKSGYHHVDIAEEHWKYLGFSWEGKFYCFVSALWFIYCTLCF